MGPTPARIISLVLHPAIFPLLGVFLYLKIGPIPYSSRVVMLVMALVFFGTYLIPVLISFLLYRFKVIPSLQMQSARDRRWPYLFGAMSFYFTALLLQQIDLLGNTYRYILASAAVVVLHLFLLPFMKPSAHMAGIGGFAGLLIALSWQFQINLLPYLALVLIGSGLVAASRLKLKAHNDREIWTGWLSGLLLVLVLVLMP